MSGPYCKIEVYVPESHLAAVRDALHNAGAGRDGHYDKVCSYHPVQGTWRPLPGSNPYDGTIGRLNEGTEYKLEVRCPEELVEQAVRATRQVHPYEVPVINVIPLLEINI